jgi:uncharacterized membrane protein
MKQFTKPPGYVWRGKGISRIEALSDAVFALALTLLVVSHEPPATYAEFVSMMVGFAPFFATFVMLFMFWDIQNQFFRWYALEDGLTKWLNAFLLFAILFYVFPLKYLFSFFFSYFRALVTGSSTIYFDFQMNLSTDLRGLVAIFAVGLMVIFGLFALLYIRAYRKREALGLSGFEVVMTRASIWKLVIAVAVATGSLLLAVSGWSANLEAGLIYLLQIPLFLVVDAWAGRRTRREGDRT